MPQDERVFIDPVQPNSLNHFEGTNGATSTTDDYADKNWTFITGATISTTTPKFGSSCLDITGTGRLEQTNSALQLSTTAWTWEGWCNSASFAGGRTLLGSSGFNIRLQIDSNVLLSLLLSSNNSSANLLNSSLAVATIAASTWYHWVVQWTGAAYQTYFNGVRIHNFASATPVSAYSGANICYLGSNGTTSFIGKMDEVRYTHGQALYSGASFTPPVAGFTPSFPALDWFDPNDMQAKNGNSFAGFTNKVRIYVGEAVTNGTVVTSTISYSHNGFYDSEYGTFANSALLSRNVNLGTNNYRTLFTGKNIITEHNYPVGDVADIKVYNAAGTYALDPCWAKGRNSAQFFVSSSGLFVANKTTGAVQTLTPANWQVKLLAERAY